jgi:hypothetical protein
MIEDFKKIGVNVIRPYISKNRWVFDIKGKEYDMAPASIMEFVLSPLIIGADKLIAIGCQKKNISNYEKGFLLIFSENYFPNADVKFVFVETKYNGSIYSVEELNLKGFLPGQCAWMCPYMTFYYPEPPKTLYIKLEEDLKQ